MPETLYQTDTLPNLKQATLFYEKYEPREQLGVGISSVVRRCISRETGQEYAVKIIDLTGQGLNCDNPNPVQDKTFGRIEVPSLEQQHQDLESKESCIKEKIDLEILHRVENEVKLLRSMRGKPDIIYLVESFKTSAYYFLVFELMNRGELFDYLTSEVSLSENRCRRIMKQIFNALRILHNYKIIHRDVKMENILIDNNLCIKLTDFGLSVQCSNNNETFTDMLGTVLYMSPEMMEACMFDDAPGYSYPVDMWACGVIMYTLLTGGKPPFYARKSNRLARKIMNCEYSLDVSELEDVSQEAKNLIAGLLCYDTNKRLTANQAYNHPFIRELYNCDKDTSLEQENYERTKTLSLQSCDIEDVPITEIRSDSGCNILDESLIDETEILNTRKRALSKFRKLVYVTIATIKLRNLGQNRISSHSLANLAKSRPYDHKSMRHLIDQSTYDIYGHWLNTNGIDNSHALLFENTIKIVPNDTPNRT